MANQEHTAYLLLGTNQGNKLLNLELAKQKIEDKAGKIFIQSSLYETAAWGLTNQPDFINQAIVIHTKLNSLNLLHLLLQIEKELGRVRLEKWGQRIIDIDILFFDDEIVRTNELTLPHPELQNRRFVLEPLNEIAADLIHPILKINVNKLLHQLDDNLSVNKVK